MTRRGHGEGTIYRRPDGRWCGAVRTDWGRRKFIYGKTREEVARRLAVMLHDVERGITIGDDRTTVAELLAYWLENAAKPSVRPNTFTSYSDIVRLHLVPELGRIKLGKLTPMHVQSLINRKMGAGYSPRRVEYMRAGLRRALNHAVRWHLVARNVATLVNAPNPVAHKVQVQPFDAAEAGAFLAAVRGHRLEALYCAVLACGLRQGEALGLCWDDVDLTARTLAVRRQLQYRKGSGFCLVDLKTARSHRTIHLPKVAARQLTEHKRRQAIERLPVGAKWNAWNLVFTSKSGRPLWASNVTHEFQRVLMRSGLRRQRFHDLRHACASLLLAQGVSARVVMEVLGHSQISVTLNTYSHVVPALQREAADRMDDPLR